MHCLKKKLAPEFVKTVPGVIEFMKSDLALRVFVPEVWKGIEGFPLLELKLKDTLPSSLKSPSRFVNPRLYENAHLEFQRMSGYMYVPSNSPIASPLVVAPKATEPVIRLCGDYRQINMYVERAHYSIPHVQNMLKKARLYTGFVDLDLANSFHQISLADKTSLMLSVQTPWGLVRPLYMPEGVSPASGILQTMMRGIFQLYDEWSIVIFDNILLLAHDYKDAFDKLYIILKCAVEYVDNHAHLSPTRHRGELHSAETKVYTPREKESGCVAACPRGAGKRCR